MIIEGLKSTDDFDRYWTILHETLKDDYTRPREIKVDDKGQVTMSEERTWTSCRDVANAIAHGLVRKGLSPRGLCITSSAASPSNPFPHLKTKVFGTDLGWANHTVCEADGVIYDPVLPKPLPHDEYLDAMFDEEVTVSTLLIL